MKKLLFGGSMIALLLWQCMGYQLSSCLQIKLHQTQQAQHKNEAGEKFTILHFESTSSDFDAIEWIDKREFKFKGKMYDLIGRQKAEDGTIDLICFQDEKEDDLRAELNNSLAGKSKGARQMGKAFSYIQLDFFEQWIPNFKYQFLSRQQQTFVSFMLEIEGPPPQLS